MAIACSRVMAGDVMEVNKFELHFGGRIKMI